MIPPDPPRLDLGFHAVPPAHLAAVVTALEMTAPPSSLAEPPANMRLERLDASAAARFRALYRAVGEPWLWVSHLARSDAEIAALLDDPRIEIYAARSEADAEIGLVQLDFRETRSCEIVYFGLLPQLLGRGLGRALMTATLLRAWRADVKRVWLHTCTLDHPSALAFYQRAGFTPYARYVEILPDPRLSRALPCDCAAREPML